MVGILRTIYDRKTGEIRSKEIIEVLDMTEDEYYEPLVKIIGDAILNDIAKNKA
ncbi:hypothetical protein [Clostridium butyricum]|uniref:hypothetical protein n=1 Tax=Clostridium butyricum TaxID=1492 RepID=UPI000B317859|nr:hypothetical protein [Clostridium butyricum]MCI3010206.1 hypothetical protein [Clostridium butyricum]MDM8131487.1 hypothetical protein [Clostridium butyricum]MDM8227909.1 hypothetical protein [Clostridium butyricum]MDP0842260.1 hypothetical protein [Clostridium butyricum]NVO90071.1 hypothetical protein [Clostridium butyricum]